MTLIGYWLIDTDGLSVEQDFVTIFQWPALPVTQAQLGAVECLQQEFFFFFFFIWLSWVLGVVRRIFDL